MNTALFIITGLVIGYVIFAASMFTMMWIDIMKIRRLEDERKRRTKKLRKNYDDFVVSTAYLDVDEN